MDAENEGRAEAQAEAVNETQFVTFTLEGEEFGVPIQFVKEIVRIPEITRIPKAPAYLEGVANLRGDVLPLVNLRQRFGLPSVTLDEDSRAVVLEVDGHLTGLMVDRVSEVLRVPQNWIEQPPVVVSAAVEAETLSGIAKLEDGKRLVLLLDIQSVLPSSAEGAEIRRSLGAAQAGVQTEAEALDEEQLVSFRVAGEEYALEIMRVQEIIRVSEITHLPNAPDFIEGLVALRNRLLPILNLRKRFRLPECELDEDSRIVVVSLGGAIAGLLVDGVSEVMRISRKAFEPPPPILASQEMQQLRGVAKLEDGKRLILLLELDQILSRAEIDVLAEIETGEAAPIASEGELAAHQEEQFVSFRVAAEEYGVPIHQVQEIIWLPEITRVPQAPYYVEGVVNLRGNVLPVIDVRKRFQLPGVEASDSTSIVVVDLQGRQTGMIVDAVSEVRRFSQQAIEPPPAVLNNLDTGLIRGVGKLEGGRRMLMILDLQCVLGCALTSGA